VTRYASGRRFEWRVKRFLERRGWFVVRSAGSHGIADLVALRRGCPPMLVQCKADGRLSPAEREIAGELEHQTGGSFVVAYRLGRHVMFKAP